MFTKRDIHKLVETAELPELSDKNVLYPLLTKKERQKIIKTSQVLEEKYIASSIEIQKVWRGYRTRTLLFSILRPASSCSSYLSSHFTSSPTFSQIRSSLNSSRLSVRARSSFSREPSRIELSYQKYTEEALPRMKQEILLTFQGFCAFTIQSWWRELHPTSIETKEEASPDDRKILNPHDASCIIQKAWRKHVDKQVFSYYKDLIDFRSKGDAKVMLKCINPKECELLDFGSGVHVRFRLGGVKFPPNIYYKVFSHINVADICSFAPRNYTKAKELPPKLRNCNEHEEFMEEVDDSDWYKRIENNGWRPVCDRIMKHMNDDVITYQTSRNKIDYNHNKLQRRQDVELRKKKKKIDWMKKMYTAGMLQVKEGEDAEVRQLVDTAAKGVFNAVQENGVETVEDWEVDELLQWTHGLNFDSYLQDWHSCGTTEIRNYNNQDFSFSEEEPLAKIQNENA